MRDLPHVAEACFRTGISDRDAALLVNAALIDYKVITPENEEDVVVKTKIRREKEKVVKKIEKDSSREKLKSLYFDGRKDDTKIQTKIENKFYRTIQKEEHITLLEEPGSKYITHLSPSESNAKTISDNIVEYFENNEMDFSDLTCVGCDGTVVNTGTKCGIICLLERKLNKPL